MFAPAEQGRHQPRMRSSTCSRRASASPGRARTEADAARARAAAAATQGGPGPQDPAVPAPLRG
eukprot:12144346-Heterocapsa_arctica.AAC.1